MTVIEPTALTPLDRALDFTADDLAANTAGRLSDRQAVRLARAWGRQRAFAIGVGVALVFLSALFLFLGRRGDLVWTAMGLAFSGLLAGVIGIGAQAAIRYQRDTLRPVVRARVRVERVLRVVGGGYLYVLRLKAADASARDRTGAEDVRVTKEVFNAFADGGRYAVYRTQGSRALLAAEAD